MSGSSAVALGSLTVASLVMLYAVYRFIRVKKVRVNLQDKVVLITGASSGLGEACAKVFYSAGAKVILCARRKEELERVKNNLLSLKRENVAVPEVLPLDLADIKSIGGFVDKAAAIHGKIDILINNGGVSNRGDVLSTSIDTDIKIMTVNYFGTIALTKAVIPLMKKAGWGHIVCISSVQGRISIPFRSAYAASKHALQAFCDSLRAEITDNNIKVSIISPGYIHTNLSRNALTGDGSAYGVMDETTASGMAAEDVASKVASMVVYEEPDVVLAPLTHRLAIYIRALAPSLYFYIMGKRARKQRNLDKKFA